MKKLTLIAAFAALFPICLPSHAATRDETMARIEALQLNGSVFSPGSPFLESMLQPAFRANPGIDQDARDTIRKEAGMAMSKVMAQPGGLLDVTYRAALAPMSDAELERLLVLLSDPVWRKFSASMTAPATQQQMAKALLANTQQMNTALNAVLAKHGLPPTH